MKKTVRLAGIAYESLVNGPGIRRVFFAQGCKHNCKGCFNPETHSFDKGIVLEIDKLIKDVLENPMITGVTFSGGDPIEQAHSFSYMAKILKNKGVRSLLGEEDIDSMSGDGDEERTIDNTPIQLHNVVDADSSQTEAIEMARSGKSFVLQGPPGTG